MSKGEKITIVLTALLLCAAIVFLSSAERGSGRYTISALPEAAEIGTFSADGTENALPDAGNISRMANADPDKISLNTASAEELTALPGIGEVRAAEIVRFREENEPFRQKEDIMDVPGIGEGLFRAIEDRITAD